MTSILEAAISARADMQQIMAEVSSQTGVSVEAMKGPRRARLFVQARDRVAYLARRQGLTLPQIARGLNRDHTTILAAVRREKARRGEL